MKQSDIIFQRLCDNISHTLMKCICVTVRKIRTNTETVCFSNKSNLCAAVTDVDIF